MSENPLLKTPGELINEARQAQDLTIAQLSERTKIPPPVLTALELDEYHKISGPLYIKSFLRTCAMDLGLDPEIVLDLYNKISGEKKSGAVGAETVWNEDQVKISRVGLPWVRIILITGIVITILGVGLFTMRGCGAGDSSTVTEEARQADSDPPEELLIAPAGSDSTAAELSRYESLMNSKTEQELRQRAAVRQEMEYAGESAQPTPTSPHDSLATGWLSSDPPAEVQPDSPPELPVQVEIPEQEGTLEQTPDEVLEESVDPVSLETVSDPVVLKESVAEELEEEPPLEPISAPPVDSAWPVVLQIVCDSPRDIQVKRDGDPSFSQVRWPSDPAAAPVVPEAGFETGRAYQQNGRMVVFWGAEDHFSLKMSQVRGVEVFINGVGRDVSRLRPDQELILDAHAGGTSGLR